MKISEILNSSKSRYILVTFSVSAIGFLRSFVLLKVFDFTNLGIVALSQTVTISISLLQFGVVTGAYRLFSYKREAVLKRINDAVFVFFLILTAFLMFLGSFLNFLFTTGISTMMIYLLILIGATSLYSNWVVCKLLGAKKIQVLNIVQFTSALISFIVVLFAKWGGLNAVLLGLLLQPVIIISIAYAVLPNLIPKYNLTSFKKYIRKIILLGFVPYLTSALSYFNSQLGRWIITFSLGTAILGRTYLVTLFVALVSVFPAAISNLFFPAIIEKFEKGQTSDLRVTLKRQLIILSIYYCLVITGSVFCAKILISSFLPDQLESINLVYAAIPALLFLHLSNPAVTLFNAAKRFKQILYGSLLSVFSYITMLGVLLFFMKPVLLDFFIIESISAFIFFIYNAYYYTKLNNLTYQ